MYFHISAGVNKTSPESSDFHLSATAARDQWKKETEIVLTINFSPYLK